MKWLFASMLLFAFAGTAAAQQWASGTPARAAFQPGGKVNFHLGAGDATIVGKPAATEIVITFEAKDEAKLKEAKSKITVTGTTAEVHVSGPHNDFRYTITMPAREEVVLRMSAGDLKVSGVDGSIDAQLHAGDCNIELGAKADEYGPVDLSNRVGDLNASVFGASKSGMFRHFKLARQAKYKLHVHVGAGDLNVN